MDSFEDNEIDQYLKNLDDEDQNIRLKSIEMLGKIGDELCLKILREKLKFLSFEHRSLIIAVGKLKRKLNIK
jgi:HEAT repeat protein